MLYNVKAFIANNNEIVIPVFLQYLNVFYNLLNLQNANTIVLSHNEIIKIKEDHTENLQMISKLSLSHNLLTDFPYIKVCKDIKELRLNSNKISNIPSYIKKFDYLNIFDIGSNEFKEIPLIIKEIPVLLYLLFRDLRILLLQEIHIVQIIQNMYLLKYYILEKRNIRRM